MAHLGLRVGVIDPALPRLLVALAQQNTPKREGLRGVERRPIQLLKAPVGLAQGPATTREIQVDRPRKAIAEVQAALQKQRGLQGNRSSRIGALMR